MTLLLFSCERQQCREHDASSSSRMTLKLNRTEKVMFNLASKEETALFLQNYQAVAQNFFHQAQYPGAEILADRIFGLINDPYIDTLNREASEVFGDDNEIIEPISEIYSNLNFYYPRQTMPEITTVVSGLYNDLYIDESDVIIGIDFFIGPGATYKPLNVPAYIQRRYTKHYLPAILAKFLAGQHVRTGKENSLLSEMIDFGKINYFVSRLSPCSADSIVMGYSPRQMAGVVVNEERIWRHFIEKSLLYETSEFTKQKYLGERPNIYEISKDCPGRVGAWIGWKIVEAYMANTNLPLKELLEETDHHKIFAASGYKPASG